MFFKCFYVGLAFSLNGCLLNSWSLKGTIIFNVIIVGAGKVGRTLAREIEKSPSLGLKIVGFLDDFKSDEDLYNGHTILGKLADFTSIARREFINQVYITIHHDSHVFLQLLEEARDLKLAVRVIPQGFELTSGEFFKYNIGLVPILEYSEEEHMIKQFGKRLFDFSFSFSFIMLFNATLFFNWNSY